MILDVFSDALRKITNADVKEFLECRRSDIGNAKRIDTLSKKIRLGSVSTRVVAPRAKKRTRIDEFAFPAHVASEAVRSKQKSNQKANALRKDTSTSTSDRDSSSASEFEPPKKKGRTKSEVISPQIASVADRCGLSNQDTFLFMSTALASSGENLERKNLSLSTVRERRHTFRSNIAGEIRENFDPGDSFLMVHYDENKMPDFTGGVDKQMVNVTRLCIVVSTEAGFKLLEVPKLNNGQGNTIANAVYDVLNK